MSSLVYLIRRGFLSIRYRWQNRRPLVPSFLDHDLSSIPRRHLKRVQASTFRFSVNEISCIKNPFDLGIYTMLLGRIRPRTIIEIGSASGGSAVWFAIQCRGLGLETHIYSLDIERVTDVEDPNVTFLHGDIFDLGNSELPRLLATSPRPLLVIEDGPHTYEGSLAALEFFDEYLTHGEYIVIEDGIVKTLGWRRYQNGPNRAIKHFLSQRAGEYLIDRELCDFYGRNVTWNTNGYLKKVGRPTSNA